MFPNENAVIEILLFWHCHYQIWSKFQTCSKWNINIPWYLQNVVFCIEWSLTNNLLNLIILSGMESPIRKRLMYCEIALRRNFLWNILDYIIENLHYRNISNVYINVNLTFANSITPYLNWRILVSFLIAKVNLLKSLNSL